MKKRMISAVLTAALAVGLLAGCGGGGSEGGGGGSEESGSGGGKWNSPCGI